MLPFLRALVPAPLLLAAFLALPLAGCVTGLADRTTARAYPPRPDWRNVAIVTERPGRRYVALGTVSAFGDEFVKEPRMEDQLRHQAARLGADAVLVDSTSQLYDSGGHSSGKHNSGLAIKYVGAKDAESK